MNASNASDKKEKDTTIVPVEKSDAPNSDKKNDAEKASEKSSDKK